MLDKRSEYLLNAINSKCAEGRFNVLNKKELILSLPDKYKADEDLLRQMLVELKLGGFIEIKYEDGFELCLAPTVKGRAFYEEGASARPFVIKTGLSMFFAVFFAVFAGITLSAFLLKALAIL